MYQECDECSSEIEGMPYRCNYCGSSYCKDHRLPENHNCSGSARSPNMKKRPRGSARPSESSTTSAGATFSNLWSRVNRKIEGRITYGIIGAMWITFVMQLILAPILSEEMYVAIFGLSGENIEYVWTWITSIFAHGGFWHIIGNTIGIFFLGRVVEKILGNKNYLLFFFGSAIIAGLTQAVISSSSVVGASGGLFAILGFITIISPDTKIFVLPIPLPIAIKYITGFLVGITIVSIATGGISAGGIAQLTHLVGITIGLLYGKKMKDKTEISNRISL